MLTKLITSIRLQKATLACLIFLLLVACVNNDVKKLPDMDLVIKDSANFTEIEWLDSLVDVGNIKSGSKSTIKFRFKNTGSKPLYIIQAKPGCGCTVADYPKQAITVGNSGEITAVFDSKNKPDEAFHKNIMVTANTKKSTYYLYFFGKIDNPGDSTTKVDTTMADIKKLKKNNRKDLILIPIKK